MNIEQLINLVLSENNLWDMRNRNYHNRDMCREKWQKISEEMGLSVEAVKAKWRGLRDTYRREVQKQKKTRSGDAGGMVGTSSRVHFKALQFLHDQFVPRQMSGNLAQLEMQVSGEQPQQDHSDLNVSSQTPEREMEGSEGEETPSLKRTRSADATGSRKKSKSDRKQAFETILELEREKMRQISEQSNTRAGGERLDPEYHYMMSLVHSLKKIPEPRKHIARGKIEAIFRDEEARNCSVNTV